MPNYKDFKTVMEMVYVLQKMSNVKVEWTTEQIKQFEQNFADNMEKCQKSKKFCREYNDYENAVAQRVKIIPPKNKQQRKLNKIIDELVAINLACQPYQLENKEIWRKQADTRLKYEKRLLSNRKKQQSNKNPLLRKHTREF